MIAIQQRAVVVDVEMQMNIISHPRFPKLRVLLAIRCLFTFPAPVSANPLLIALPVSTLQIANAGLNGTLCRRISYDQNGNRLSSYAETLTTDQSIWGSSVYGCRLWE